MRLELGAAGSANFGFEPRPTFLDFIDKELIEEFMHELRDRNVAVRLGPAVNSIERNESGSVVTKLSDGRHVTSEMNTFNYPTLAEAYKIAGLDAWNRMSR